jgi:hypothetical protein
VVALVFDYILNVRTRVVYSELPLPLLQILENWG